MGSFTHRILAPLLFLAILVDSGNPENTKGAKKSRILGGGTPEFLEIGVLLLIPRKYWRPSISQKICNSEKYTN